MEVKTQTPEGSELQIAHAGPAFWVNRFYITIGPAVRIAFVEREPTTGMQEFRTAVALSHQDAIALAHVLSDLLKPIESQLDEAMQKQEGVGGGK